MRGIQYAAAFTLPFGRFGILDRPVEPGDDTALAATALRH
jgi:hypothetical protein